MNNTKISGREAELIEHLKKKDIMFFGPREAENFLKISRGNAHKLLQRMKNKDLVVNVERGKYILADRYEKAEEYEIASNLVKPSYLAFWSSLHFHKMTEQVPRKIFVATTRRKRNKTIRDSELQFVNIRKDLMFGYEKEENTVVSNPEKTILDCLIFPQYSGGIKTVYKAISQELDVDLLVDYCLKIRSSSLSSRTGYLLEKKNLLRREEELQETITTYSKLSPGKDREKPDSRWKIYRNVEIK